MLVEVKVPVVAEAREQGKISEYDGIETSCEKLWLIIIALKLSEERTVGLAREDR